MTLVPSYDFTQKYWFFVDATGKRHEFSTIKKLRKALEKEVS